MRVAVVQQTAELEPDANRARLDELTPEGADLVVWPEAFARDFGEAGSDVSPFAEPVDGPFAGEVERVAEARSTTVVAGMFETSPDEARPFNTLVVRGGAVADYRKIHLYDSFGYRESDRLTAGPIGDALIRIAGFTVGLMTCYDLRFPELARSLVSAGAEVLVVPAAWVAGPRKVDHWRTLLRARAVENTTYVVGAAQPAPRYSGHSMIVDPHGDVLAEAGEGDEIITGSLDSEVLADARRTNPSLLNRRM